MQSGKESDYSTQDSNAHKADQRCLVCWHVAVESTTVHNRVPLLSRAAHTDPHGQGALVSRALLLPRQGLQGAHKRGAV